jgi:nicotinate-nucleotide--dimethylbenzimidazole phosphoribosyltransferase
MASLPDPLARLIENIPAPDRRAARLARARQLELTKPPGSLGRLEELAVRLAAATGSPVPVAHHKVIFVLAADHGVARQGVSAYPQAVTAQMVANFLAGGAAINALARAAGARVVVADFGVIDPPAHPGLRVCRLGPGTADFTAGPAMTREQAVAAIKGGIRLVEAELETGLDLVGTGEMGIGNTTAAAAVVAALLEVEPARTVGPGTGLDPAGIRHKVQVVDEALRWNRPDPADPLDVLAKVGGFELAGLVGVVLGAAARRRPVVLDGYITGAAALVAVRLCPPVRHYLIASHRSAEPGHRLVLRALRLRPLLDLRMRLGEGTGAALAFMVIEAALRAHREMRTFAEAGVSGRR